MPNLTYEQARSLYDAGLHWSCEMHYYAVPGETDRYALSPRIRTVNVGRFLVGNCLDSVAAPDLEELLTVLRSCTELVMLGNLNLWCDECVPGYHVRFGYHRSMLSLNEPQTITADCPRAIDAVYQVLQQLIEQAVIDPVRLSQYMALTHDEPVPGQPATPTDS